MTAPSSSGEPRVAVVGYGASLRLESPFMMNRLGADKLGPGTPQDTLLFGRPGAGGRLLNLMICPGEPTSATRFEEDPPAGRSLRIWRLGAGGTSVFGSPKMTSLSEVGEMGPGLREGRWAIEARGYRVAWPEGLLLRGTEESGSPYPFELAVTGGERDEMVLLQGPHLRATLPPFEELVRVGEGLELVARTPLAGMPSVEVRYSRAERVWRQLFVLAPLGADAAVLGQAQAPEERRDAVVQALLAVTTSLAPA